MEKSNKYSLSTQIYNAIRAGILEGKYSEDEFLQEIRISEEFGVSRTPVREALKQLEQEGLVEFMPNRTAKVSNISIEDIEDIYEIRSLIEGLAARWAAEKITDEEIECMQESIELAEFYTIKGNAENLTKEDSNFHQLLYSACNSKYLQHILTDFHQYSRMARVKSLSDRERSLKALEEHKAIFEALKEHNAEKAEKFANQHVRNAKENLIKNINK